jgi:hypothetical protein
MQTLVAVMQPDAFREAFALEKTPVTIVFFHFIWKESGFKGRWWDSGQFHNIAKFELGLNSVPFLHELRKWVKAQGAQCVELKLRSGFVCTPVHALKSTSNQSFE